MISESTAWVNCPFGPATVTTFSLDTVMVTPAGTLIDALLFGLLNSGYMKKLVYVLVVLFAFCAFGHAQQNVKVDIVKDSTVFYVSSPFANIYLSGGLGIQTLIGNETVASARYNPITPYLYNKRTNVSLYYILILHILNCDIVYDLD